MHRVALIRILAQRLGATRFWQALPLWKHIDGKETRRGNQSVTVTGIAAIDGVVGNDTITGSSGADTIIGNAGNDTLNGGDGGDTYLLGLILGLFRRRP